MSLSTTTDFNEASPVAADFNAQKIVQSNSAILSADVNTLVERALRRTRYLKDDTTAGIPSRVAKAGDTMSGLLTANAGITVASGQSLTLNGATVQGVVEFASAGRAKLAGRKQLLRPRVGMVDANATLDVNQGDRFEFPVSITPTRTITIDKVSVVPEQGETITVFWFLKGASSFNSTYLSFQRNDATVICTFVGSAVCDVDLLWAEFEYVSGVWRLGKCAGTMYDGTANYGVIAGAGA